MIRQTNEQGNVCVSTNVYEDIAGTAASYCVGVKGMAARSMKDGVYHLLRKESMSKGVKVTFHEDQSISIAPSISRPRPFTATCPITRKSALCLCWSRP